MPLTGMHDVKSSRPSHCQHGPNWLNRGTSEGQVVAHLVHIATTAAEVDLHINYQQHRIFWTHIPIKGIRIGVSCNKTSQVKPPEDIYAYVLVPNAPGAPVSVRWGEQVIIMIAKVKMYGEALNR